MIQKLTEHQTDHWTSRVFLILLETKTFRMIRKLTEHQADHWTSTEFPVLLETKTFQMIRKLSDYQADHWTRELFSDGLKLLYITNDPDGKDHPDVWMIRKLSDDTLGLQRLVL